MSSASGGSRPASSGWQSAFAQCDFAEPPFGWCFPNAKVNATQKVFFRPDVILPKTQTGGACPTQKRLPPKKVFAVLTQFCRKPVWVVLAQCESGLHPKRFCSSRRNFDENAGRYGKASVRRAINIRAGRFGSGAATLSSADSTMSLSIASFYNFAPVRVNRLGMGRLAVDVAEYHKTAGNVIFGNAPRLQKTLAAIVVERLFAARDNAR